MREPQTCHTCSAPAKVTRRRVTAATAWSVPVIAVASTAPAYATSIRKDPGINGWMLVTTTDQGRNTYDLRFDSDEPGTGPDGAPFGLYIYDPNLNPAGTASADVYAAASITLWIRTDRSTNPATTITKAGSGAGWSNPVNVGAHTKPDGLSYRGYRFDYSGAYTLKPDGRVWLTDLVVVMDDIASADATYWVERAITINGGLETFQRRNGARGPHGGVSSRVAAVGGAAC